MADVQLDVRRFGSTLRGRREQFGLSIRQVAGRASVSDAYLGSLEKGEGSLPSVAVLARLAAALKTSADELLADYGLPVNTGARTDLAAIYDELSPPGRRALIRIGQTLRDLQGEYSTQDADEDEDTKRDPRLNDEERMLGLRPAAVDKDIQPPPEWPPPEGEVGA